MSLSRRRFLLASGAAVGSAAALAAAACAPGAPSAAPGTPASSAPTLAPGPAPSAAASPSPAAAAPSVVPSPSSAPAVAPASGATLKIGVLVPYTESSIGVDIGLNQKRAADLYLKRHGGKLGGRPATLVYSSESIEAAINKVKVKTLLETEKVELLMGAAEAETAYVMRDSAEAAKLVYVDTNATANALTRTVPDCKPTCQSKYTFRTSATSWQLSEPLGEWASRNGMTDFFVCGVDETFGIESADAFEAGLGRHGGKATARNLVASGGDWSKLVGAIKAQSTRQVFAAFQTDDAEGFIKQWAKQGMRDAGFKLYGPGQLTEQEVLNQIRGGAEGIVTAHFWTSELDNAENKALVDLFPQEYRDDESGLPVSLNGYAVAMWDAMTALDEALTRASGNARDSDALIAALEGVSFKSPRGAFAFEKGTHNPIQDIYIREVTASGTNFVNALRDKTPAVADPGS